MRKFFKLKLRKKNLVKLTFVVFLVLLITISPNLAIWLGFKQGPFVQQVSAQQTTTLTSGTGTWNVPTGVTSIVVEAWGGGGGGAGGGGGNNQGNGGGGGGEYAIATLTNLAASYSYSVGAGGAGGSSTADNAQNGGNSVFGNNLVVANGGSKGNWLSGGLGTGGIGGTGGTGDTTYSGGRGGDNLGNSAGGGGGGAGTTEVGGDATNNSTGGIGGTLYGGNGGDGGSGRDASGTAGSTLGGGGGSSTRARVGLAGARGEIRITYTIITTTVGTTGTQKSTVAASTADFYIGGAFTFVTDTSTTSVTSIKVSQTGTISDTNISGLILYYKQEATCSTSIPVDATQFNSTPGSFTSGSSTVTGTMSVGTSQVCLYVEVDIGSGAQINDTIEIQITNPSTDVIVTSGTVSPATAVAINGTTTITAAGFLSIDIVDASDVSVTTPSVQFSNAIYNWITIQTTATLGVTAEQIKISNFTTTSAWTLSIAATGGASDIWDGGANSYQYNGTQANGRLQVDPSVATITPGSGCTSTGITKQSSAYFVSGSVDSINLLIAGGTAETSCDWYITGVSLTQDIPEQQAIGTYSIGMTLTVI